MQYITDVVPWPSLALLAIAAVLVVAAWRARKRRAAPKREIPAYASWDAFVRDVLDPEIPVDHILERCGGKLPANPMSRCVACGAAPGDARHSGSRGTWTHCDACAVDCPICQEAEIRRRIDAEHQRMRVGSAPCSFCQQLIGGGR